MASFFFVSNTGKGFSFFQAAPDSARTANLSPKFYIRENSSGSLNESYVQLSKGNETRGIDFPYFYVKEPGGGLKKYGGSKADRQLYSISRYITENENKEAGNEQETTDTVDEKETNLTESQPENEETPGDKLLPLGDEIDSKGQDMWRSHDAPPGEKI
jgi:hypothetical protein